MWTRGVRGGACARVVVGRPRHHLAAPSRAPRVIGRDAIMVGPSQGVKNLTGRRHYSAVAAASSARRPDEPSPRRSRCRRVHRAAVLCNGGGSGRESREAPTLPKITRLRATLERPVAIFGGLGGVYFFEELSRGSDGAMTGFPYPEALAAIREHFVKGQRAEARALFYRWLPLIRYESQPGAVPGTSIALRKEILRRRGWLRSAYVRPPATALDPETLKELDEVLSAVTAAL